MANKLVSVDDGYHLPTTVRSQFLEDSYDTLDDRYGRHPATIVYVNPVTGSDSANGASATPLLTIGEAVRRAELVAQEQDTTWTIRLAAGTYGSAQRVRFADFTPQNLNVTIEGPSVGGHPNVPTALFTEGSAASTNAILARNPNLILTLKDIKGVGYRGTTSSSLVTVLRSTLYTINVHTATCFYGVSCQHGVLDVKGGIFDNNGRLGDGTGTGAAIRSLMLTRHSIGTQSAGSLTNGPIITNNRYGLLLQENSTGHVDWTTIEDNERGIVVRVNSRANVDGTSFRRNGRDVSADTGGRLFVSENTAFGTGANASTSTVDLLSSSEATSTRWINNVEMSLSRSERAITGEYATQTLTGSTTETNFLSRTLRAPMWKGRDESGYPPLRLRFRIIGQFTGTVGTKTIRVRLGSTGPGLAFPASTTGSFVIDGGVMFINATRQLAWISGNGRISQGSQAQDLSTADIDLKVTGQLGDATDTITCEAVELYWG